MNDPWPAVVRQLERGGVVGHPTETVYGFAASATAQGVAALRHLKARSGERPFLVLLPPGPAGRRWRDSLTWTPAARKLTEALWPGPLTIVLGERKGRVPEGIANPHGGVAVRVSPHPVVATMLQRFGEAILSTSANPSGDPPARTTAPIRTGFAEALASGELLLIEGGELAPSLPSTVVDCTGAAPRVLREGAVSSTTLRTILGAADER